jgi:hypothetical protein
MNTSGGRSLTPAGGAYILMATRISFAVVALGLVVAALWAYHHDDRISTNAAQVTLGDPNEVVRELLGEPSSQGPCGSLTPVPTGCTTEYVYRYYYSIFQPRYEVIWFDHAGKVLGEQNVKSLF